MTHYIGVVHKDADSDYGIHFPDLPGCFSADGDLVELERNAIEAIDLFLEGEEAAAYPARDMNAVRAELDVDDAHAMLMAIPFVRAGGRTVRVNFTVDAATLAAIDAAAKRRNLSRSAFLVSAAHHEIAGH